MIHIDNVKKTFGHTEALKGISLHIEKGEIFGLLGPNGAGKTTIINILSTLLKPDEGKIEVAGKDIGRQAGEVKTIIGVIPQEIALYKDLTARQNLIFWGKMHGLNNNKATENAGKILKLISLDKRADEKVKNYSGGMKRRVNIGVGLMHAPEILLMDEPTVGIDPQSRNQVYEIIEKLKLQGITIIYTTHYMDEAEKLCDRIGIIDHGEIIAKGSLEELKKLDKSTEAIIFHLSDFAGYKAKDFAEIQPKPYVQENKLIFSTHDTDHDLPMIMKQLNKYNLNINMIDFKKTNLETLFLNLTGRTLRE